MRRMKVLAPCILLLLALAISAQAKGWRDIIPLYSTRADVIKKLGRPNLDGNRYELKDETVTVVYSAGPCVADGWNVPKERVIAIMVEPSEDITLADLRLDLKKFVRTQDHEVLDAYHYKNDAEGLDIAVIDGLVRYISYEPGSGDASLKCAKSGEQVRHDASGATGKVMHLVAGAAATRSVQPGRKGAGTAVERLGPSEVHPRGCWAAVRASGRR